MSMIIYIMQEMGFLNQLQTGITAIVIVSLVIYVLKKA